MTITSLNSFLSPELAADQAAGLVSTATLLDLIVYDTQAEMPAPFSSGVTTGTRAYCTGNNTLYAWSGTGWYKIATVANDLTLTTGANVAYTLATDGTPTYVNLAATSSNPVTWTYGANASLGNTTVSHTAGNFTITPSTSASDNGVFLINFTAYDSTGVVGSTSEFSLTISPYTYQPYGWFGGGTTPGKVSTVDRINYASDTGTASVRGPLSADKYSPAATGNDNFGWFAGGVATPTAISTVDRIDYANDGVTASVRGPLVNTKDRAGATGNNNYGWVAGGEGAPTSGGFGHFSIVDRIDYAVDTNTASIRGPLTIVRYGATGTTGNDNYGWVTGGIPTNTSVDRIDYAADTTIASVRGPVNIARANVSATGNANYGWFAHAGNSNIDRINYAADTGIASSRGTMILPVIGSAATGDVDYGWFAGGYNGGAISTVDRIDYAADTGTATARGVISTARFYYTATGGYPG